MQLILKSIFYVSAIQSIIAFAEPSLFSSRSWLCSGMIRKVVSCFMPIFVPNQVLRPGMSRVHNLSDERRWDVTCMKMVPVNFVRKNEIITIREKSLPFDDEECVVVSHQTKVGENGRSGVYENFDNQSWIPVSRNQYQRTLSFCHIPTHTTASSDL